MAVIEKEHTITVSKHPKACGTIIVLFELAVAEAAGRRWKKRTNTIYHLTII